MIVQTDESSSAASKWPVTVQKRCRQTGRSRRAVQQRRRRGRRSFVVVRDARAASELSPIAVVSASRPCLPTVGLSPGSSVQSGCDSGTQERPNEIYTVNKGIDRCVCSVPDKRSDN